MMKKMLAIVMAMCLCLCAVPSMAAEMAEKGAFRLDYFSGGAMGITFTEIVVDEEGAVLSLWTNSNVTDVKLERLIWADDSVVDADTLFEAERMDSTQVLNIHVYLPDVLPILRVSATNEAGERESWYITDSGEDGSLLLFSADELGFWEGMSYTLCSGVGAWSSDMLIYADGAFSGQYHDSDMGDMDDDYPNGTVYLCDYTGRIEAVEAVDEFVNRVRFSVSTREEPGQTRLEDGFRLVLTGPHGLEETDTLVEYKAGIPVKLVPEACLEWAWMNGMERETEILPFDMLFNPSQETAFVCWGMSAGFRMDLDEE